jgi:hypothetical protein
LVKNVNKTPDLLDFFIFKGLLHNYLDIKPNIEIASDHIPSRTHILTRQQPPKLHKSKRNWEVLGNQIEGNLQLDISPKTAEEIEEAITEFNNAMEKAVGVQHQTTTLKLNIRNSHGKSRTKLRKNEN